ncbi:hypothetical protein ACGF3G_20230 [Streptomyces sp. NPDC048179]|uniref:hypothetical protein n=1 Tax=Streptomyces sp. NPDC048179 TaxID=3365506 RepID=UPI00371358EF
MYKRRRVLGTYLGMALATLLPGVSVVDYDARWLGFVLPGLVFVILNQLIHTYPSDIRNAPAIPLLVLAAIGIVQDTLIWLLVSWIASKTGSGIHVHGFLMALAAGATVRVTVLVLFVLGPQPVREDS